MGQSLALITPALISHWMAWPINIGHAKWENSGSHPFFFTVWIDKKILIFVKYDSREVIWKSVLN